MIRRDQGRLNSLTKFPSIETYHAMDGKGLLLEQCTALPTDIPFRITEKVDGVNTRIIFFPTEMDYFIGSREELLHARGDRIEYAANPGMSIVPTLIPWAEHMLSILACHYGNGEMVCVYGEVYGGTLGKVSKQYTEKRTLGFRVFDTLHMQAEYVHTMMSKSREAIAAWRDNGGNRSASTTRRLVVLRTCLDTKRFRFGLSHFLQSASPRLLSGFDGLLLEQPSISTAGRGKQRALLFGRTTGRLSLRFGSRITSEHYERQGNYEHRYHLWRPRRRYV